MSHIQSKASSKKYRDGWDKVYGASKDKKVCKCPVAKMVRNDCDDTWVCTACGKTMTGRERNALWPR